MLLVANGMYMYEINPDIGVDNTKNITKNTTDDKVGLKPTKEYNKTIKYALPISQPLDEISTITINETEEKSFGMSNFSTLISDHSTNKKKQGNTTEDKKKILKQQTNCTGSDSSSIPIQAWIGFWAFILIDNSYDLMNTFVRTFILST